MKGRRCLAGSMLMEFVMVMPLLMILVMLVLQFAMIATARPMVAYAAFCAARSTLVANPQDNASGNVDFQAARRALAWVTTLGTTESRSYVSVPGWGQIPESNSVDKRLIVKTKLESGRYAAATVTYYYPLLIPIAGQMIGWLTRNSWRNSAYVRYNGLPPGWFDEVGAEGLIDGMPFIKLMETSVLPLPYSPEKLPSNAFDYLTYK